MERAASSKQLVNIVENVFPQHGQQPQITTQYEGMCVHSHLYVALETSQSFHYLSFISIGLGAVPFRGNQEFIYCEKY